MSRRARALDVRLMRWAGAARRSWLTRLIVPYTLAGTLGLPWVLAGAAVDHAEAVVIAAALGALVAGLVKRLVARDRPAHLPLLVRPLRSGSFPSGHAASSAAAACVLLAVAPGFAPIWIAMAVTMAASRVYVGVHYPTDVLAGVGVGVLTWALPIILIAAA